MSKKRTLESVTGLNSSRDSEPKSQKQKPAPKFCKFGCGHSVCTGFTNRGNPFDTCCRDCAVKKGATLEHSQACHQRHSEEHKLTLEEQVKQFCDAMKDVQWLIPNDLSSAHTFAENWDKKEMGAGFWDTMAYGAMTEDEKKESFKCTIRFHVTRYCEVSLDKRFKFKGGFSRRLICENLRQCYSEEFTAEEVKLIRDKFWNNEIQDTFEYVRNNLIPISEWKDKPLEWNELGHPNWPIDVIKLHLDKANIDYSRFGTSGDYWKALKGWLDGDLPNAIDWDSIDLSKFDERATCQRWKLVGDARHFEGLQALSVDDVEQEAHLEVICGS